TLKLKNEGASPTIPDTPLNATVPLLALKEPVFINDDDIVKVEKLALKVPSFINDFVKIEDPSPSSMPLLIRNSFCISILLLIKTVPVTSTVKLWIIPSASEELLKSVPV